MDPLAAIIALSVMTTIVMVMFAFYGAAVPQESVRGRLSGLMSGTSVVEAVGVQAALKENRLGDVLAQGKKLPPKAALAGEDWLKRIEMRYQIEQALAETEAALKSSLAAGPAGSDRKK